MTSATLCFVVYIILVWVSFKLANRPSEPGFYQSHDNADLQDLLKWATRRMPRPIPKPKPRKKYYVESD